MTTVYFYLLLASGFTREASWNVTPMPSMEVCEQTLKEVMNGISDGNYGIVTPPSAGKCITIINEGKRASGTAW